MVSQLAPLFLNMDFVRTVHYCPIYCKEFREKIDLAQGRNSVNSNLHNFNLAMLYKQAWNPHSLAATMLKAKYSVEK
ncbi:conserved hypothetical protein [Ricinus communis]|uniref:Uncharacterized protein n=1 Tax=Ricinus communis TaxID=3988 RepID=B9STN9_RICCO|nr:conserved hypothetical protein [Ricinus communis]